MDTANTTTSGRPAGLSAADIVRFYLEAGVDTPVLEMPVDRTLAHAELPASARATAAPALHSSPGRSAVAIAPSLAGAGVAAQIAAACTSLEALREAYAAYEGCGLKKTANRLVFSDGVPGARVMLIGEAPGRDEDMEARPFVGKTGQFLDRMLAAIGLDRTSVYIANTVGWRPPANRAPTPEETAQCMPFVLRQIELAAPEVLVLVGGQPTKALAGLQDGITQIRGQWQRVRVSPTLTLPALPMLHPGYLLRTPSHKRHAWQDLLSLKRRLEQPVT